jgi:hypothetical protein
MPSRFVSFQRAVTKAKANRALQPFDVIMPFDQAVQEGERQQEAYFALQVPAPSLGDAAKSAREQQATSEKAHVAAEQGSDGKIVVVKQNPTPN